MDAAAAPTSQIVADGAIDYMTAVTRDGMPLRTLSRRIDGAFTSPVNPIAVWEIKIYCWGSSGQITRIDTTSQLC